MMMSHSRARNPPAGQKPNFGCIDYAIRNTTEPGMLRLLNLIDARVNEHIARV
jgi:hypothetical protein